MISTRPPALIALDWGTTSLRAYLLDSAGDVLERKAVARGIMKLRREEFADEFNNIVGAWRERDAHLPAIASGMIGSAQGWMDARYVPCPADISDLVAGLVSVPGHDLAIVPGVARQGAAPDVMRGEETQVAGVLAARPDLAANSRFVMPGTHSKWVTVANGQIVDLSTFMSGELFAILRNHSILGRSMPAGPADEAASDDGPFIVGVDAVRASDGISPLLFSARALHLTGGLGGAESVEYLSGLLIGDELRCALARGAAPAALVGDPALCRRYGMALARFGIIDVPTEEDAAPAGLFRIAAAAGLPNGVQGGRS